MFYTVGLIEHGFRKLWAYGELIPGSYLEEALEMELYALVNESGEVVDWFLPTENIYLGTHLYYYNIPNGVLVQGSLTQKTSKLVCGAKEIRVAGGWNYEPGVYHLEKTTLREALADVSRLLPPLRICSSDNLSLFQASLAKKIADTVLAQAWVTGQTPQEVRDQSDWYEWFVHYLLYAMVELPPHSAFKIIQDEIVTVVDAVEAVNRTWRDVILAKAKEEILNQIFPIIDFYIANPNEMFLYDADRRNLNVKFGGKVNLTLF